MDTGTLFFAFVIMLCALSNLILARETSIPYIVELIAAVPPVGGDVGVGVVGIVDRYSDGFPGNAPPTTTTYYEGTGTRGIEQWRIFLINE